MKAVWPQSVYQAYLDFGPPGRWAKKLVAKPFIRVVPDEEYLPRSAPK